MSQKDALAAAVADFPAISSGGSYPAESLKFGAGFGNLIAALTGPELNCAIGAKFAIDLGKRPTMLTIRGMGDEKDGSIHTDSETKIITLLLYMNPVWNHKEGRLRLLRRADDLDDYAREVAPLAGTMLAFQAKRAFIPRPLSLCRPRRSLQLNWVTDVAVVSSELRRHRWSARLKALNPFAAGILKPTTFTWLHWVIGSWRRQAGQCSFLNGITSG